MNIADIIQGLEKVDLLLSDLRLCAQLAEDQDADITEMIRQHTFRDPSLLGAVLNLAALIKP